MRFPNAPAILIVLPSVICPVIGVCAMKSLESSIGILPMDRPRMLIAGAWLGFAVGSFVGVCWAILRSSVRPRTVAAFAGGVGFTLFVAPIWFDIRPELGVLNLANTPAYLAIRAGFIGNVEALELSGYVLFAPCFQAFAYAIPAYGLAYLVRRRNSFRPFVLDADGKLTTTEQVE